MERPQSQVQPESRGKLLFRSLDYLDSAKQTDDNVDADIVIVKLHLRLELALARPILGIP